MQLERLLRWVFASQEGASRTPREIRRIAFVDAAIILLGWIPVFLAFFPGIFAYDVQQQLVQQPDSYTTHHPLVHTLYLIFFYNLKLGKTHNGGIALSVIVQMVVLACSQGAVMGFLVMRRVRDAVRRVIVGFCALMPIFSVMAVSVTKDVPYTAAFVAVMLCACVIEERPESLRSKRLIVAYVVVVVFTCLLRNNGVVAVILMMIGGTVAMRMRSVAAPERRRFVAVSVVALCVAWAANMGLKMATHAESGSSNEIMSLPYQQLARVYAQASKDMDAKDAEDLNELFPYLVGYDQRRSDPIKDPARVFESDENLRRFVELYVTYGLREPRLYLEGALYTSIGFWYLDDISNATIYDTVGDPEDSGGYFLMDTKPDLGVERTSLIPWLEQLYLKLFHENAYQEIPVFGALFSMGLYLWLEIFAAVVAWRRGRRMVMPCVLLGGYVLTLLFGPCALIRYAFPYVASAPLMLSMAFGTYETNDGVDIWLSHCCGAHDAGMAPS